MSSKMTLAQSLVIALLIYGVVTKEEAIEMSRSFTFSTVVNTSLDSEDQILERHGAVSVVHCAHKCLTNKQCWVIGFNIKSAVCWLMKSVGRNGVWKSQDYNILMKIEDQREMISRKPFVEEFSSCKKVFEKGRSTGNGIYNIKTSQTSSTRTYCHMEVLPDCGGGGWTLTMKIDGTKNTFNYNSSYWTNRQALKTKNGLGLEDKESKLPTYWSTPLTKICLGMKTKIKSDTKWLKLELKQRAASLYDVITKGYPAQPYTLLGVNKWKMNFFPRKYLVGRPYFEGVSVYLDSGSKVRLGVISKFMKYPSSQWRDSVLGFGMWYRSNGVAVSCGKGGSKQLSTDEPAFCYILTQ